MKRSVLAGFTMLLIAGALPAAAQTLTITADPATATIYKLKAQDNSLVPMGVGSAKLKLEATDSNTIVVRQDGYREVRRSFPKDKATEYKDKNFTIFLNKRIVQFTALPYDASILVNGESKGQRSIEIEVLEGQTTTVEVKKTGFASVTRVYRWEKGGNLPATEDRVELADRKVMLTSSPSGVELVNGDTKIGDGNGEFVIKRGTCGTVIGRKAGWIPMEREWCNKEGMSEPPITERLALAGRIVNLTAPPNAKIFVNQKQAGTGAFAVNVADGSCVKVRVEQTGFLTYDREYCAQPNAPVPPLEDNVVLKQDDSYSASVASDQANVNVTLEVNSEYQETQAWKLLASIVLSHFDVLENSDSQTGYLRTAWQVKTWGDSNEVVIRTRIIVKRSNDSPLRYTIKLVSERNKYAGASVKEDENFVAWDRLLNTYKDVIGEVQSRLK